MNEKNIIIIMLMFIIIILLIFFLVHNLGSIEEKIPTGNIDIYDITIIEKADNEDNSNSENTENKVIVYDENGRKINKVPLQIFDHKSYYVKDNVIAPGTENSYQCVIRNNNDFAIIYNLNITETNKYNINMKFRLKQNGKYVLGDDNSWVSAQELKQNRVVLANNSYNVYTLDWKWFESENDTKIGKNIESNYELDISFYSERY